MSAAGEACTAIVPTLDREHDLERCLRSLAAARPSFAAIVVVDQAETPALEPRVTALGARYLHLDRRGLSRARNVALAIAATPWIYFPDDDATVAPDVLAEVAAAWARHPRAAFVAARVLTPAGRPILAGMTGEERVLAEPADVLATVMSPGLFVTARLIERIGPFDERFGIGAEWPSGEESDLLFRAFAAGESGVYAPAARVVHPDPFAIRDADAGLERARLYGRGLGALLAKHAAGPRASAFAALRRRFETRALGGALGAAATLDPARARRHWQSWQGRREGWRGWRAAESV
jgi:GT2 family glycosyltransferase